MRLMARFTGMNWKDKFIIKLSMAVTSPFSSDDDMRFSIGEIIKARIKGASLPDNKIDGNNKELATSGDLLCKAIDEFDFYKLHKEGEWEAFFF